MLEEILIDAQSPPKKGSSGYCMGLGWNFDRHSTPAEKKIVPRYGTSIVHGTQKNFNRHSASIEKSCGYRIATAMVHGTRHLKIIFTQNIFISYFRTIVFEEFSLDTWPRPFFRYWNMVNGKIYIPFKNVFFISIISQRFDTETHVEYRSHIKSPSGWEKPSRNLFNLKHNQIRKWCPNFDLLRGWSALLNNKRPPSRSVGVTIGHSFFTKLTELRVSISLKHLFPFSKYKIRNFW